MSEFMIQVSEEENKTHHLVSCNKRLIMSTWSYSDDNEAVWNKAGISGSDFTHSVVNSLEQALLKAGHTVRRI